MSPVESAHASGASIDSLVLACCAAVRHVLAVVPCRRVVEDAVDVAEGWATGDVDWPTDSDVLAASFVLQDEHTVEEAARWLLDALLSDARRNGRTRVDSLDECAMACAAAVADSPTINSIIESAIATRDTIPCPPSDECVAHGLEAA